MIFLTNR